MLSCLYLVSFGLVRGFSLRRLFLAVSGLMAQFQCRLFLLIDIRRSCKLLGAMLRAMGALPGGLGWFLPCWEKSGHGLTSGPRETSNAAFLDELLVLCGYPPSSGSALLEGTLPLRYCVTRFAHKVPTWKLPARGGVADLVDSCGGGGGALVSAGSSSSGSGRVDGGSRLTGPGKRVFH